MRKIAICCRSPIRATMIMRCGRCGAMSARGSAVAMRFPRPLRVSGAMFPICRRSSTRATRRSGFRPITAGCSPRPERRCSTAITKRPNPAANAPRRCWISRQSSNGRQNAWLIEVPRCPSCRRCQRFRPDAYLRCRPSGRHQSLRRRAKYQPETLPMDRGSRQNYRRSQKRAPSVRFYPLEPVAFAYSK
jgi:hypothetical protein